MKIIGITGGVGAGKTQILEYLSDKYGASVCQTDKVAKKLQKKGGICYDPIVEHFGTEILDEKGELDRKKLSDIVFGDPKELNVLNEIVHPAVKEEVNKKIKKEERKNTNLLERFLSWRWKPPFSSKTITIRSVMSSGIYMWRMQCAETVFTIPGDMIIRRLMRLLQHSCQRRCS